MLLYLSLLIPYFKDDIAMNFISYKKNKLSSKYHMRRNEYLLKKKILLPIYCVFFIAELLMAI